MTSELQRKIEETTMENGVEKKELTSLETSIKDSNGNQIAIVSTNKRNCSIQIYAEDLDVQAMNDAIVEVIMLNPNIVAK